MNVNFNFFIAQLAYILFSIFIISSFGAALIIIFFPTSPFSLIFLISLFISMVGWLIGLTWQNMTLTAAAQQQTQRVLHHYQTQLTQQSLSALPAMNPNPILQITTQGHLLYANSVATQLFLPHWKIGLSDPLPTELWAIVHSAILSQELSKIEIIIQQRTYSLTLVLKPNAEQINVYGHDITYLKQTEAHLKRLNTAYERFVSRAFLKLLGKNSLAEIELGDHIEREMTVMFSDIRGFTSLSESMTPQDNFAFINAYLSRMEPVIRENRGFIDKYIGDAIMALFPHSADDALQAGIGMLKRLREYNATRGRVDRPILKIGIGIHSGLLMLGTIGGQQRMDGTVISDAVNAAARVEGLTKTYKVPLLITDEIYKLLRNPADYHIRVIDHVRVKGKTKFLTVYEVFDADLPEVIALKLQTLAHFAEGFKCYHNAERDLSRQFFEKIIATNQQDEVAKVYLERCM